MPNWGTPGQGPQAAARADATPSSRWSSAGARRDRGCSTTTGRVVTADGRWPAHSEHTIAITDDGPEILTLP